MIAFVAPQERSPGFRTPWLSADVDIYISRWPSLRCFKIQD